MCSLTPYAAFNLVKLRVTVGPALAGQTVYVKAFDVDDPVDPNFDLDANEHAVLDPNDYEVVGTEYPTFDMFGNPTTAINYSQGAFLGDVGGDNRADTLGTPGTGRFVAGAGVSVYGEDGEMAAGVVNTQGFVEFVFQTGMQPGNNYRVAMTLDSNEADFALLRVDGSTDYYGYVSCDSQQRTASGFGGTLSPLLTIWRKVHVEQDSMGAVPTDSSNPNCNYQVGTIDVSSIHLLPEGKWETERPNYELTVNLELSGGENRYKRGTIFIGTRVYRVIKTQDMSLDHEAGRTFYPPKIIIEDDSDGHFSSEHIHWTQGATFLIRDDDGSGGYPNLNRLPEYDMVTDKVRGKFAPAYIELDTTVNNPGRENPNYAVPLVINMAEVSPSKDIPSSYGYWASRIIAAFQGGIYEDLDPDYIESTLKGVTVGGQGDSFIFLETIRDASGTHLRGPEIQSGIDLWKIASAAVSDARQAVIAHELGHHPGGQGEDADHSEGGLMRVDAGEGTGPENVPELTLKLDFSILTIRRFRSSLSWAE